MEENQMLSFLTPEMWTQVKEPPKVIYRPYSHGEEMAHKMEWLVRFRQTTLAHGEGDAGWGRLPPSSTQHDHQPLPLEIKQLERGCHNIYPTLCMSSTTTMTPTWLRIWQQNITKSKMVQEDLDIHKTYDLIFPQEPYLYKYGNSRATRKWRVVYLSSHISSETCWINHSIHAS